MSLTRDHSACSTVRPSGAAGLTSTRTPGGPHVAISKAIGARYFTDSVSRSDMACAANSADNGESSVRPSDGDTDTRTEPSTSGAASTYSEKTSTSLRARIGGSRRVHGATTSDSCGAQCLGYREHCVAVPSNRRCVASCSPRSVPAPGRRPWPLRARRSDRNVQGSSNQSAVSDQRTTSFYLLPELLLRSCAEQGHVVVRSLDPLIDLPAELVQLPLDEPDG